MKWRSEPDDRYAELHGRASDWFEANQLLREAFHHAEEASDLQRIAALIIKHRTSFFQQGRFAQMQKWLALLPKETIQTNSILFIAHLWVETTLFDPSKREPPFEAAQAWIEHDETLEELDRQTFLAQIDALRTISAVDRRRLEDAQRFAERALNALPEGEVHVRPTVNLQLGHVQRFKGDFENALSAYRKVINAGVHTTSYFLALWYALRLLRVSNRLAEATDLADHIIAQHNVSNELPPLVGFVLVESAALNFERGRFEDALSLVQQALPLCELVGFVDLIAYVHHLTACLYISQQQPEQAESAHQEMLALLPPREGGDRATLRRNLILRFARLQGDMQTLNAMLADGAEWETGSAELQFEAKIETAWGYLAKGEPAQVLATIDYLRQSADNRFGFLSVPYYLLTAAAHHLLKQDAEAQVALVEALTLAVPQGNVAPFFFGGDPVKQHLQAIYPELDGQSQQFVETVFGMWGPSALASLNRDGRPDQSKLVDPLTERELEILQLLANGFKNKEIAEQLFISVNTVQYHNKNIFSKLGVSRRGLALLKARELNLID